MKKDDLVQQETLEKGGTIEDFFAHFREEIITASGVPKAFIDPEENLSSSLVVKDFIFRSRLITAYKKMRKGVEKLYKEGFKLFKNE